MGAYSDADFAMSERGNEKKEEMTDQLDRARYIDSLSKVHVELLKRSAQNSAQGSANDESRESSGVSTVPPLAFRGGFVQPELPSGLPPIDITACYQMPPLLNHRGSPVHP